MGWPPLCEVAGHVYDQALDLTFDGNFIPA